MAPQKFEAFLFGQRARGHCVWGLDTVQCIVPETELKEIVRLIHHSPILQALSILFQDGIHYFSREQK